MGFSITSAVLGGIIIICYGISIIMYREQYKYNKPQYYDIEMAITSIILVLGIVELVIGILAAACISATTPICYGTPPQQVRCVPKVINRQCLAAIGHPC